jgi:catecholate siderophore receptor
VQVRAAGSRRASYRPTLSSAATRTPASLRDIPQSITAMPAPLLRDLNLPTVARAMEYVPGVVMGQGEGHRDAPTIRGQSTTADFFVDGVRDDAQYYRDTYNVSQLEVLRGANAAAFGRGGGGGVINRVIKRAEWAPVRSARLEAGGWNQRRAALDIGQALTSRTAVRLNVLHERGDAFRRSMGYERFGVNPTAAMHVGRVLIDVGAERFSDRRTVDRGLPSASDVPAALDPRVFAGDPAQSTSTMTSSSGWLVANWQGASGVSVRSHSRAFAYDKFYQNVFPSSPLNAARTQFSLGAYNATNDRRSLFNQTDVRWQVGAGAVRQVVVLGTELSAQRTENLRHTGYFNDVATAFAVPVTAPTVSVPVVFRQSASDAANRTSATVAAAFLQEQLTLGTRMQLLGGLRFDRVAMALDDHRSRQRLARTDALLSPRLALVYTPAPPLSLYSSWSVSHLPSSGDQFASLSVSTQALGPERFRNREVGAKWVARPELDITAAWFVLDRTNTSAPDPLDATRLVQTGQQQTQGVELGVQGAITTRWDVMGGLAVQRARIVDRTSAARVGATVPLVPRTTASVWNKVAITRTLSLSAGVVHQGDRYAAIDNTVRLPHFTRLDAGVFLALPLGLTSQVHVENVAKTRYTATSHGNNNIMPGAGRTVRVVLTY